MKFDNVNTLAIADWFKDRSIDPTPDMDTVFDIYKTLNYRGKIVDSVSFTDRVFVAKKQIDFIQKSIVNLMYDSNGRTAKGMRCGYVYAISNPAWPDHVKIGCAIDVYDRLKSYQTSSPFRDYELIAYAFTDDRLALESKLHSMFDTDNEWVMISKEDAKTLIKSHTVYPEKMIQEFCLTELIAAIGRSCEISREPSAKLKVKKTLLQSASGLAKYLNLDCSRLIRDVQIPNNIRVRNTHIDYVPIGLKFSVHPETGCVHMI